MAKKIITAVPEIGVALEGLGVNNHILAISKDELEDLANTDPEQMTLEVDDECDLTDYTFEDLLEVTRKQYIGLAPGATPPADARPAIFVMLPFANVKRNAAGDEIGRGETMVKRFYLGALKKRIQQVDKETGANTTVVKTNALSKFRNYPTQAAVLAALAGKKIRVTNAHPAINPNRDRVTRAILGWNPTTVYDFDLNLL